MGQYNFEGTTYNFPDDVSDQEALTFIQSQMTPAADPNAEHGIDPMQQSAQDQYPAQSPFVQAQQNVPPTTGQVAEPDQTSNLGDFGYAVLDELGTFLGLGAEGWEQLKRSSPLGTMLAQRGSEIREPGEGISMFKEALRAAGIPQQQVDNAASRFGSNLTWNVILTGLGVGAGRALIQRDAAGNIIPEEVLAQQHGVNALGTNKQIAQQRLGRALGANPGEQIGAAVGGSITQTMGETENGEDPVSSLMSYLPGGAIGAYGQRRLKGVWDYAVGNRANIKEPIANQFANPMNAAVAAEDRIARDTAMLDGLTKEGLLGNRTKTRGGVQPWNMRGGQRYSRMTNEQAQTEFDRSREYAEDTVRQIESRYWDAALDGQPIDTQPMIDDVLAFKEDLIQNGTESTTPKKFFDEIEKLEPAVPAQKVQGLIRDVYAEIKRMRKDPTFSGDKGMYRANLNKLEDILRSHLEANATDPVALDEARALTRNRKSRFDEGVMGDAKYLEGQNTVNLGGGQTLNQSRRSSAQLIASTADGPDQLQAAHDLLTSLGVKSDLATDFENAVRMDYIQSVSKVDELGQPIYDPRAADSWMKKHAGHLGTWKSLLREVQDQTALMRLNAAKKAAIRKGVIGRIARTTESAMQSNVNNVFGQPDALKNVRKLTDTFSVDQKTGRPLPKDHDNIDAWELLATNAFVAKSKGDAVKMAELLKDPEYMKLMKEAFRNNPDRLERLQHVVGRALILGKEGEKQDMKGLVRNTTILLSGVWGAKFGTALGTGSIQVPGYTAKAARGIVGEFLNKVMPAPPGEKLWWAIHTPEGYNWMMNRVPSSLEDTRKLVRQGRRMLALLNTQTHEKTRQWLDEWGIRPRDDE